LESPHHTSNEGLDKDIPEHVHIVTNEDMVAYREYQRLNRPTDPNVFVSPLGDESVDGYRTDSTPQQNGVKEIRDVVQILESASIACCMVAESALIYYGTGRIMLVCVTFLSVYWIVNVRIYSNGLYAFQPTN
jgi:hypothetical protein